MADQDQLSGEDLQALQAVHQHLLSVGDPRAPKVKSYLDTQDPTYADPTVLTDRQRYRQAFGKEPPLDYPKHMPGTGLDEMMGAGLGTGLLTAPLTTLGGVAGSTAAGYGANKLGLSPEQQMLAQAVGGLAGGGLVAGASHLPSLSDTIQFALHPKATMIKALLEAAKGSPEPIEKTWKPINIGPLKPSRFSQESTPAAPIPPVQWHTPQPEQGFTPAPPMPGPSRFAPSVQPGPQTAPVPPVIFNKAPTAAPLPTVPPVAWHTPEPATPLPTIPPVPGPNRFAPSAQPIPQTAPIPPVQFNNRFASPEAEGESLPGIQPLSKFEMNRMAHARAQEMNLPGSPAKTSGHPQLSQAAKDVYGVGSWSDLSTEQMKSIHNFMDANKRMPVKGELK